MRRRWLFARRGCVAGFCLRRRGTLGFRIVSVLNLCVYPPCLLPIYLLDKQMCAFAFKRLRVPCLFICFLVEDDGKSSLTLLPVWAWLAATFLCPQLGWIAGWLWRFPQADRFGYTFWVYGTYLPRSTYPLPYLKDKKASSTALPTSPPLIKRRNKGFNAAISRNPLTSKTAQYIRATVKAFR